MPITAIITKDTINQVENFLSDNRDIRNDVIEGKSIFIGTGESREDIDTSSPLGLLLNVDGNIIKNDEGDGVYSYNFTKNNFWI